MNNPFFTHCLQEIDPLDRFRMVRNTTYITEIVPPANGMRDTCVYRLRCKADLFKLQLSWRYALNYE
jgi:hypothetical protein